MLQTHINARFDALGVEIERLGKEPSNDPLSEMNGLLTSFVTHLEANCLGRYGHKELMQAINAANAQYKQEIWSKAPRFVPYTLSEIKARDEPDSVKTADYVRNVSALSEGSMGPGGSQGEIVNLDDVSNHIKR
jgi:hypothetical protein